MSDPASVRAHVEKIQSSAGFANADRLRRFLQFTVEAHLKGESNQLKEYVLGREVFDRDDNYDPRMDPIVRVEARRLRQRLAEYYDGPGSADSLRIEFPKGTYAPAILAAPVAVVPIKRTGWRLWLAFALAAGIAGAAYFALRPTKPVNALAIVPARWTFVDPSGFLPEDEAVAEAITAQVANRGKIAVIGWPSILPYRAHPKQSLDVARETGAVRVMAVSVRQTGAQMRVTVFLVNPYTGQKMWAEDFYAQDLKTPDGIRTLAATVAHDLELALGVP